MVLFALSKGLAKDSEILQIAEKILRGLSAMFSMFVNSTSSILTAIIGWKLRGSLEDLKHPKDDAPTKKSSICDDCPSKQSP
jgi:hypothetical protein